MRSLTQATCGAYPRMYAVGSLVPVSTNTSTITMDKDERNSTYGTPARLVTGLLPQTLPRQHVR